jgi:Fe-S cluster biogenesis protein NfuA
MENPNKKQISYKVVEALNSIRPYLMEDGGNIKLIEITDDLVVKVELQGTCTNCQMNNMTFKAGVEEVIMKEVPQIKAVEEVNLVKNR